MLITEAWGGEPLKTTIHTGAKFTLFNLNGVVFKVGGITIGHDQGGWVDPHGSIVWEPSYSYMLIGESDKILPATEEIVDLCLAAGEHSVLVEFQYGSWYGYKFFTEDNL